MRPWVYDAFHQDKNEVLYPLDADSLQSRSRSFFCGVGNGESTGSRSQ